MSPKTKSYAEPQVTPELVKDHGLSEEEHKRIVEILKRELTYTELGIFSVMWSEHCSYKNSIAMLKTFPREGKSLLAKAGEENAGAVDIGDGLAIIFKIESHNHPCAVEPYQGAATGVGGIMRDVFTMGARPIACLDSLRFGDLSSPRVRYLFDGVVRGIGDYGNCFGVPTVGGEVYFDDSYTGNPLVNPMSIGIVKVDQMATATAKEPGSPVLIVGASTGRDGIHGVTFASEEISEKSEERRPSVQIGDPFMEKLLLEASLEIIKENLIVGIQDMGGAGISCSTSETAARGKSGIEIDVSLVPAREENMTPYEIMLSESQERMLVIAKKGYEKRVQEIFTKWGLNSKIIGKVTVDKMLRVKNKGKVVAEIPAASLVLGGGAPVYVRERTKPKYLEETSRLNFSEIKIPEDFNAVLLELLVSPNIASKRWVYEQYDTTVRTGTVVGPRSDACVIRLRKTNKAIAATTDCNGRYCYLNPRMGGRIAVAEAARNLVCSGAKPLAITNCLNFGNPYDPEVYWTFAGCVTGMGEACRTFDTPVTGGNVSFYNEDPQRTVYPTPVVGMVGLIEDVKHITTQWFKDEGDVIVLLGETKEELGASEYLKVIHNLVKGDTPNLDLEEEKKIQDTTLEMIRKGLIKSAHDCSEGGLAVTLAESCISSPNLVGADIKLVGNPAKGGEENVRPDALLFGESQSRIVVTTQEKDLPTLKKIASQHKIFFSEIGRVGGEKLKISTTSGEIVLIDLPVTKLLHLYEHAIERLMEEKAS
ncbi:MAG: phosphoribosylformylglycinamidine synthase [candidate division Zixibacteria bacterium SM23_73]|nr:MAG: phosphoribosylformylglycinamidine synthase [candidate division Zixibacteria bacterium SM23_73]